MTSVDTKERTSFRPWLMCIKGLQDLVAWVMSLGCR